MSCDRHYGIAGYAECSGNGQCVDGFCVCNAGWSSIGDYELVDGYDCDTNITVIRYFAIAFIILSIPSTIYELFVFYKIYKTRHCTGKQWPIVASFVASIFGHIHAILKYIDPVKYVMGGSLYLCFNHSFIMAICFGIGSIYSLLIMAFLEGYFKMLGPVKQEQFRNNISKWKIVMKMSPFWVFTSSLIIQLVGLYAIDRKYSDYTNIGIGLVMLTSNILHLTFITSLSNMFITEIKLFLKNQLPPDQQDKSSKNQFDDVQRLLDNSILIYRLIAHFLFNGTILYLVSTFWKFFRRKATYFDLMQMILMNMVGPLFIYSLENNVVRGNKGIESSYSNKASKKQSSKIGPTQVQLKSHASMPFQTSNHSAKIAPESAKGYNEIEIVDIHRV